MLQKDGTLSKDWEALNNLLEANVTDEVVEETYAKIMSFTQSPNVTLV